MIDLSEQELKLMLEALEDAAYYRDTRSHVLQSAVRRSTRRGVTPVDEAAREDHQGKARDYRELAKKLKARGG